MAKPAEKTSYTWQEMVLIGFGVLGIGFLIAIAGYILTNHK